MVDNLESVINCLDNEEKKRFHFNYLSQYPSVKQCVLEGKNCEYLCKEFRFGSTSQMFIGNLDQYYHFYQEFERVVSILNQNKIQFDHELIKIDDNMFDKDFFMDEYKVGKKYTNNYALLKDFNMTQFDIIIKENEGINLFDISVYSRYYLTDQKTRQEAQTNYDISSGIGSD